MSKRKALEALQNKFPRADFYHVGKKFKYGYQCWIMPEYLGWGIGEWVMKRITKKEMKNV